MPTTFISGDQLQVKQYCYMANQLGINVLNYQCEVASLVVANMTVLADQIANTFRTLYAPLMPLVAAHLGVSISRRTPQDQGVAHYSTVGPLNGSANGDAAPSQCCGVITRLTDFGGPKNRGRAFIPFPPSQEIIDGYTFTGDYVDNLLALGVQMYQPITYTQSGGSGTFYPTINKIPGVIHRRVTGCKARTHIGTQRRRGGFGRPNQSPF